MKFRVLVALIGVIMFIFGFLGCIGAMFEVGGRIYDISIILMIVGGLLVVLMKFIREVE